MVFFRSKKKRSTTTTHSRYLEELHTYLQAFMLEWAQKNVREKCWEPLCDRAICAISIFFSATVEKMEVKILAVLWILHLLFQANCRQSGVWFLNQRILIVHCFLAIFNRSCWYKNWTLIRKIVVCHVKIAWCWKHFEMIYYNN